jgi:hypothetical protein
MRHIARIEKLIILAAILFLSCNNIKIDGRWRDRDIIIDGVHNEWENVLLFSEKERATVGFINDDEYLYLCLMAADQQVLMQSLVAGFTVWFDGMGHNKEKFGIGFPVGMRDFKPGTPSRNRGDRDRNRLGEMLQDQSELELIRGDGTERINLSELDDYGISLKINQHLGRFLYELKIPLNDSNTGRYGIVPKDDGTVKVGFELGEMKMPERDRRPPGNGAGFPGRMSPGGEGGMPGPRRENRPGQNEEFKFWISLKLADRQANN